MARVVMRGGNEGCSLACHPGSGCPDPSLSPKHWPGSGAHPEDSHQLLFSTETSSPPQIPVCPMDVMLVHTQLLALALHPPNPICPPKTGGRALPGSFPTPPPAAWRSHQPRAASRCRSQRRGAGPRPQLHLPGGARGHQTDPEGSPGAPCRHLRSTELSPGP